MMPEARPGPQRRAGAAQFPNVRGAGRGGLRVAVRQRRPGPGRRDAGADRPGLSGARGQLWAAQTVPSVFGRNGPSPSDIKFLTSTDGGRSWRRLGQATNLGPFSPEVRVSLTATAASGLTWATVYDQLSCAMHGCAVAELAHSGTGGRTWSLARLPDRYPDECARNGIVFSAAQDGSAWAATGASCPGRSWRQIAELPGVVTQLDFWSARDGIAASYQPGTSAPGRLWATSDGGRSWTRAQ